LRRAAPPNACTRSFPPCILEHIGKRLPSVRRVTAYGSPGNFSGKSVADLARLRRAGLTQIYMGFESGDDEILRRIDKGVTHDGIVAACDKLQSAGIKISAIIILGLGGPALSARHAERSARLVNRTTPRFLSALTLVVAPTEAHCERYRHGLLVDLDVSRALSGFLHSLDREGQEL
jgi:radical SAM superfamily enzyme YgiQ (UPF0313 family)